MTASPSGEVVILILSLAMLVFFLFRELSDKKKSTWRLGLGDFFARPSHPQTKSIAAVILGAVFIGLIVILIIQRMIAN